MRTVVLDTNVLLINPRAAEDFEKTKVVIPFKVIEELDAHKTAGGQLGGNARSAIRWLDGVAKTGNFVAGITIGKTIIAVANWDKQAEETLTKFGLADSPDNRIIATALACGGELVSNDLAVRLKAGALGLKTEAYSGEMQAGSVDEIYSGVCELVISEEQINALYAAGEMAIPKGKKFYPNQYILLKSSSNDKQTAIGRAVKHKIKRVEGVKEVYGVRPRTMEQVCAADAILDQDVSLVSLIGHAGTGKSLVALAAGLSMVEKKVYKKLILVKSTIVVGDEIGFLPGDMSQKLAPVFESFYDSFGVIFHGANDEKVRGIVEMLIDDEKLEMLPYQFFRGRSIPDVLLIIDEAQNIPTDIIKTILTRVAGNSKVVLLGDISQIDNKKLDPLDNGLVKVIEAFQNEMCCAHLTLKKGERGQLAELASQLL